MIKDEKTYRISKETGFLSQLAGVVRLPNDYEALEHMASQIPHLILAGKLVPKMDELPLVQIGNLERHQLERLFSILTILANAYVWAHQDDNHAYQRIPPAIGVPLLQVSEILGINPVITHASVVLFNWKMIDEDGPLSLENVQTNHLFTGSMDESWFYLITVGVEIAAIPAINAVFKIFAGMEKNNLEEIVEGLNAIKDAVKEMMKVFLRMKERCDPYIFYNRVRKYLIGSYNCDALPNGLHYGDEATPRKYAGGSAAQSTSIQAIDALLGVEHKSVTTSYLRNMRNHMPRLHREFLQDVESAPSLKKFIQSLPNDNEMRSKLENLFNDCLTQMELFRSTHIQIVAHYIMAQSKKGLGHEKGTGGSGIMDLLKQSRAETVNQQFTNS